jgi:hypothetical protein
MMAFSVEQCRKWVEEAEGQVRMLRCRTTERRLEEARRRLRRAEAAAIFERVQGNLLEESDDL